MNKSFFFLFFVGIFLFSSCKTEFEKLRETGDVPALLKSADKYFVEGEYLKSQTLYESVLGSIRGKAESEQAYFNYAYTQYHLQRYSLAAFYFKDFSAKFLNSPLREEAEFMKAFSNYRLSPSYRLDQTYSQKAIEEFQLFVNTYPTSDRVEECNRLIDVLRAKMQEKAYAEGELYFNLRNYESAVSSFENLLKDFPETADSEKVRYMVIRSLFLYADNSVVTKQPERYNSVTQKMGDFNKKYPKTRFSKELAEISNTTNKKLKELRNEGYKI